MSDGHLVETVDSKKVNMFVSSSFLLLQVLFNNNIFGLNAWLNDPTSLEFLYYFQQNSSESLKLFVCMLAVIFMPL